MKYLIINADDFGYGAGINRGIVEAHLRGVVTSAGLMVNTPGTDEAIRLAADLPALSLGLHVNFTNEAQRLVEFDDPAICTGELRAQIERFTALTGRLPTHIDSHQHVHRDPRRRRYFEAVAQELALPLRDTPPIVFKGGFYAQWEYGVSDPTKVSVAALSRMLRNEVKDGITELACHPGYYDTGSEYVYHSDREIELQTLTDPDVRAVLDEQGIQLISFHQLPQALSGLSLGG
jgi:predicted glycoside hydrolase/deacetylase ChbG (UPF0249 family)